MAYRDKNSDSGILMWRWTDRGWESRDPTEDELCEALLVVGDQVARFALSSNHSYAGSEL